jgi:ribose transport system substrate-binding protein
MEMARRGLHSKPLALLGVAASCLAFAACGSDDEDSASTGSAGTTGTSTAAASAGGDIAGKKVAYVPAAAGDIFYITVQCGIESEAQRLGLEVETQAPERFEAPAQTATLNSVAATSPDALIVAPADDTAMFAPINQIADGGAKIVTVDQRLRQADIVASEIFGNNEAGGAAAADALFERLGRGGKVLLVNNKPGVSSTDARGSGFMARAEELGLDVVSQEYGENDPTRVAAIVTATLAKHGDLGGIFSTQGYGAIGAINGLKAQDAVGRVMLVGYDSWDKEIEALKAGQMQAIVATPPREVGIAAVRNVAAALEGGEPVKEVSIDPITITEENVDSAEVRAATLVEKC